MGKAQRKKDCRKGGLRWRVVEVLERQTIGKGKGGLDEKDHSTKYDVKKELQLLIAGS